MKKTLSLKALAIILLIALLLASLGPVVSASLVGDAATNYQVNYLEEDHNSIQSSVAGYTYYAASGQLAKKANVYQSASASSKRLGSINAGSWLVVLNPSLTVPNSYLEEGQRVEYDMFTFDTWTPVLFNGSLAYIQRQDFTPKGKENPTFYVVYTDDHTGGGDFATAKEKITVYSRRGGKGQKLGVVSKGSMLPCIESRYEGYTRVIVGSEIGYAKTSSLNILPKDRLNLAVGKAAGTYLEPPNWTYGGRITAKQREERTVLYSGLGVSRTFNLIADRFDDELIFEYQFPTQKQLEEAKEGLESNYTVVMYGTDTIQNMAFAPPAGSKVYCFENEKNLILYQGSDPDTLAALKAQHGQPFYTFSMEDESA